MISRLKTAVAVAAVCAAGAAAADVRFFERDGFAGRSFTTDRPIGNLERFGFNDRASSMVVRGGRWEVCEDARFSGRCVVLRPGRYPDLRAMGLNNQVSSVRPMGGRDRDREYHSRNDGYYGDRYTSGHGYGERGRD